MQADLLITNVHIATMNPDIEQPWGRMEDAGVAVRDGRIIAVGPAGGSDVRAARVVDGGGGWLTPGLIDCHTHLVYGGNRAAEWEARLQGVSYEEIARRGGGIVSTVRATRDADFDELLGSAAARLRRLLAEGVTTVEIKSGYGLDIETERKMLEVARSLASAHPVTIRKTFLGAHALPPEYAGRSDQYISQVVDHMLPELASEGIVDAVDVFCENIGFSLEQCRRVFRSARDLGLPVKGHVEQLSNQRGTRLVDEFEGLSADHLEYLEEGDIPCLRERSVVPVLLPGAFYFIHETRKPPVQGFREAGVEVAVASDLNPGSSPICSLLMMLNLACVQFSLTPEEAFAGVTRVAARALGLGGRKGVIREGMDADMALWPIDHPAELCYAVNMTRPSKVWVLGSESDDAGVDP